MFGDTSLNNVEGTSIMKRVENPPFIITVKNGEIASLEEVFTP